MLYKKYLKKLKQCPFCCLRKDEMLRQNKYAILTLAKAPYTKDHLLVVPKKHVIKINSLNQKQKDDVEKLICYGIKKLNKKYKNISVLYREGDKDKVGKSIDHVHYHIIPNLMIGSKNINGNTRKVYSEKEYVKKIKDMKKVLVHT